MTSSAWPIAAMAPRSSSTSTIPWENSTCVACGECVQACPTGALMEASLLDDLQIRTVYPERSVDSVCPYCGVGCQTKVYVKDEKIVQIDGRDGPANQNRLCVKGRFGFDYVEHPHRLTKPLIRKQGIAKDPHYADRPTMPGARSSARRAGRRLSMSPPPG